MIKINPKKLIEMARKWQRMAAAKRRRISYPKSGESQDGLIAEYTTDKKRFMVPLEYLSRNVFIEMARKWQRMAAAKLRRISYPKSGESEDGLIAEYTTDKKRFMVPLEYLSRNVFIELLRMSEEEFGLPNHGAITMPRDSTVFEYVISLIQGQMPEELEKALVSSMSTCHQLASSSSLAQGQTHPPTTTHTRLLKTFS